MIARALSAFIRAGKIKRERGAVNKQNRKSEFEAGFSPAMWPATEVKELASRNSIIIATSCCCGLNEDGGVCRGGSNITDADGKLLAEI